MRKFLLCTLLIFTLLLPATLPTGAVSLDTLVPAAFFTSGEEYVLALPNISDKNGAFGEACPVVAPANEYGLDYAKRPETRAQAEANLLLWTITRKEDGTVTLYSKETEEYLHLEPDVNNENNGRAYLSDESQDLQAEITGGSVLLPVLIVCGLLLLTGGGGFVLWYFLKNKTT